MARLLALRGHSLGQEIHIYSNSPQDPAAQVTAFWHQGELDKIKAIQEFAQKVDLLTFESEFISPEILKTLGTKTYPRADILEKLQDRLFQKNLLTLYGLPTAPFFEYKQNEDIATPIVLKARRNGYDGKGTFILRDDHHSKLSSFLTKQKEGCIAEDYIPFSRELAISAFRSRSGDIVFSPLVETKQEEYRCLWVKGPIFHREIDPLKDLISSFLTQIDYIGSMAFELFESKTKLIINEIAPRVHNSCHYSTLALTKDQFTLHLECLLAMPLSNPSPLTGGFAMYNLLGPCQLPSPEKLKLPSSVSLEWYGKDKSMEGRKLGHLNAVAEDPDKALEILKKTRPLFNEEL